MSWWDYLYGQSFAGSYQDASRRLEELRLAQAANDNDSWYGRNDVADDFESALRAQRGQAIAGGIVTGLTGATTLLSNAFKDAQIRDTSMQEGIISDLGRAGNYNYNNYDQLANDYAQTNFNPQFNYQDIRGMNTGQKIGSVGTSALSGAATGMQIGGPWGALAGLAIGGLTGLGGVIAGDNAAKTRQQSLNLQAQLASDAAQQNFAAAHERIGDNIHRQNAVNAVAEGGPIRRQQSIKEYADRVLGQKAVQRERKPSNIQRIMTNGGCVYRVKVK